MRFNKTPFGNLAVRQRYELPGSSRSIPIMWFLALFDLMSSSTFTGSARMSRFCECCITSRMNSVTSVPAPLESRNLVGHPGCHANEAPDQHDEDCRREDEPVARQPYDGFRHGEKYRTNLNHQEIRSRLQGSTGFQGNTEAFPASSREPPSSTPIDRYFFPQRNRLRGNCVLRAGI